LLAFDGFLVTEVNGYVEGIIVAWKGDCITVNLQIKKFQFMHLGVQFANGRM